MFPWVIDHFHRPPSWYMCVDGRLNARDRHLDPTSVEGSLTFVPARQDTAPPT